MKKKKKNEFQNIYNMNNESNAYIIDVSLDSYSELFNGWDASPLRRRDLEPELLDYLEQAGHEIPIEKDIELYFYLPIELKDDDKELKSKTGITNNFKVVLFFINKSLKKILRQILFNITLSLLFLTLAYTTRNLIKLGLLSSIVIEGLFIGGWFLLWEAFSLFFFTSYEIRQRKKIFVRFLNSKILFIYETGKLKEINT